jgi:DNA-binding NtrC family response regulator
VPTNVQSEAGSRLEHLVAQIAEGLAGQTGDSFFRSLVHHVASALDADFVMVGQLQPGSERIKTLAAYGGGEGAFEYELAGSPCENVVQKRVCSHPTGIQQMFPRVAMLAHMGAEGYVGAPLVDTGGNCLGSICALTRRPLTDLQLAESVLQIFAMRASSELERKTFEDALARSEEHYRTLVTHGNEAVVRVELDQPISMDLPEQEQFDLIYRHAHVADCNGPAAKLFGRASSKDLIGARMHEIGALDEPGQIERVLAGIRSRWQFSQVERTFQGRVLLMTRQGIIEKGHYTGAWMTARDITDLKQAKAEVRRLNAELEARVEELTVLKGRLEQDNAYLLEEIKSANNPEEMVGASPRFRELLDKIRLVAGTSATVLITGETGTGKELVARAIHKLSPRRERPLVKVNCAAISAGLVESELFGHVKGAFTGASERRVGRFEHADGGTMFLDEVTELPLESQSKLLRVLQEQEFEPVGSNRTIKVDVRVLAASNRDLGEAVREGRFRMDLYYRLQVIPVEVPPLRDRREDIPALAAHFITRLARQFGRRVNRISEPNMRQLTAYHWPGNIRELENILARAVVLCPGDILETPLDLAGSVPSVPAAATAAPGSLEEAERRHVEDALRSTAWVVEGAQGAAAVLKMNPSTLRSLMKRLGIQRPS